MYRHKFGICCLITNTDKNRDINTDTNTDTNTDIYTDIYTDINTDTNMHQIINFRQTLKTTGCITASLGFST